MSEETKETVKSPVTVTPMAAEKIKELLKDDNKNLGKTALRVFVQGGGCSGFQYGLMIDEEGQGPNDKVFESNGIKILIDPISIRYLTGAEIDFDEAKGGFTVKNPNAISTCGCGQSFNTDNAE